MDMEFTLLIGFALVFLFVSFILPLILYGTTGGLQRQIDLQKREISALQQIVTGLQRRLELNEAAARAAPDTDAGSAAPEQPEASPQQPSADDFFVEADEPETQSPAEESAPAETPASGEAARPAGPFAAAARTSSARRSAAAAPDDAKEAQDARDAAAAREQQIGGKWTIWTGGIALAAGAVFLVRFAVENDLLGPLARILAGAALGLILLGLGEWTRRRPGTFSLPGFATANIPAVLTASGTLALFADVYAAYALYDLIGPAGAFVLLGAVSLLTMFAALLHGPALAALGLAGSYAVPMLVSSGSAQILPAVLYVLAVSAAAVAVGRIRLWLWLAGLAAAGLFGWALLFEMAADAGDRLLLDLYLAGAYVITAAGFVWRFHDFAPDRAEKPDWYATAALSALALPFLAHVSLSDSASLFVLETLLLTAVPLALAYGCSALRYAAVVPLLVQVTAYAGLDLPLRDLGAYAGVDGPYGPVISPVPAETQAMLSRFGMLGLVTGAILLAAGVAGSLKSASRAVLASLAAAGSLALLAAAWWRVEGLAASPLFAVTGLALSAAFLLFGDRLAALFAVRGPKAGDDVADTHPGSAGAVAAWFTGTLCGLALSIAIVLEGSFLTTALGLLVPAFVFVYLRYPVHGLRVLAPVAILPYVCRLLWDPFIAGGQLSITPVFNQLLYGYGIPALGLVLAAWALTRTRDDLWARILQAMAIAGVSITLAMLALHAIDPTFMFYSDASRFKAAAMMVITGGSVSLGLTRILPGTDGARGNLVFSGGAMTVSVLGMLTGGLALVGENPLWTGAPVGYTPVLNWVTLGYGAPFVIYALLAYAARPVRPAGYVWLVTVFAGLMGVFFVNLTIRHAFSPLILTTEPVSELENYVYSIVWLVLGVAGVVAGLWRDSLRLRQVAGAIVALVVVKVFLFDMSSLQGVLRALSFLGLGAVLIAIGYLYQRMIARKPPSA